MSRTRLPGWAPSTASAQLLLGTERGPMHAEGDGWWVNCGPIPPTTDDAVAIDGRSRRRTRANCDVRGSTDVRRFVTDNALMWLRDDRLDGLRLDAVHAIFDMSAVHIGEQLTTAVPGLERELGRRLVAGLGGYGMDAARADDVHHAIHVAVADDVDGVVVLDRR